MAVITICVYNMMRATGIGRLSDIRSLHVKYYAASSVDYGDRQTRAAAYS